MSDSGAESNPQLLRGAAGVVWLSGADRLSFLERMSTQRLSDLAAGSGRATAVLTDIGRVVDLVICYAGAEGAALVTSTADAAPAVAAHLRRYVLRDRVRVTDASKQVSVLRLIGPNSLHMAQAATGLDEPPTPGSWVEAGAGTGTVWWMRHPLPAEGGLGGCDVVVPAGDASDAMVERLIDHGARPAQPGAALRARVQAGLPAFGAEIDGSTNPLELGLKKIVDFAKGCYIGQEVVARLDTYDKVQRRVLRLGFDEGLQPPPRQGEPIMLESAEASRGGRGARITTVAPAAPRGGGVALALLPSSWAHASEALSLHREVGACTLERLAVIGEG